MTSEVVQQPAFVCRSGLWLYRIATGSTYLISLKARLVRIFLLKILVTCPEDNITQTIRHSVYPCIPRIVNIASCRHTFLIATLSPVVESLAELHEQRNSRST